MNEVGTMTSTAQHAISAWTSTKRRRTATGAIDSAADATLAAGCLVLANAVLSLHLGLPAGARGSALAGSLICSALAWMTRARRVRSTRRRIAPLAPVVALREARAA